MCLAKIERYSHCPAWIPGHGKEGVDSELGWRVLLVSMPGPRHSLLLRATGNVWGGLRVGAALASTSRTEARRAERDSRRAAPGKPWPSTSGSWTPRRGLLQTPCFTCRGRTPLPAQRGGEVTRLQPPGPTELRAGPTACLLPAARVSGGVGGSGEPRPHERRAPLVKSGVLGAEQPSRVGTSSSRTEG